MGSNFKSLFDVHIDFSQSHLLFPRIITIILVLFGLVVIYRKIRARRNHADHPAKVEETESGNFDALGLFGTIVLTIVYIIAMFIIGDRFPNTGMGFLIASIPYFFLLSVFLLPHRKNKQNIIILISAIVFPVLTWLVFYQLLDITLP